jgi:hypothetical protein
VNWARASGFVRMGRLADGRTPHFRKCEMSDSHGQEAVVSSSLWLFVPFCGKTSAWTKRV